VTQRTLSRWIRRAGQAGAGVRPVAIVPSTRGQATRPAHERPCACSPRTALPSRPRSRAARVAPAGPRVIGSTRSVRVFAYSQPADMRKGFDGLYGLVKEHLQSDPLSGDMYLFVSGNRKRAKVLMWDGTGYASTPSGSRRDASPRSGVRTPSS